MSAPGAATVAEVPFLDLGWQHRIVEAEVRGAVDEILASAAFVGGPHVAGFEAAFAAACGVDHCVGVANGTDAIELGLRALGIGPGDTVVVPANTFIATAEAVWRAGADVSVADVDPATLLLDPVALEPVLARERPRAVIAVDLYGQIAPMEELVPLAEAHGAVVVEDAAQSQGARRHHRGIAHGVALASTSFYPGKNLGAYGDGGAVLTRSSELAERVRLLGAHGSRVRYHHEVPGTNSRLDTIQAAVLSAKLAHLEAWNDLRRAAAARYAALLDDAVRQGVDIVTTATAPGNTHAWHLYVVRVPERDAVLADLQAAGIGAAIHYPVPVHRTPAFAHLADQRCPVAESAADRILSLPMYPGITTAQQARVVEVLVDSVRRHRSARTTAV